MNLVLQRRASGAVCTIGEITEAAHVCYTVEDLVREVPGRPVAEWKVQDETAIPTGLYQITITESKRFGRLLPILNGVEGYSGVRIHPGNTAKDTDGCILPGESVAADGASVLNSRVAFQRIYQMIFDALSVGEDVFIEVRNAVGIP